MINRIYPVKKTFYIVLAATILIAGSPAKGCKANTSNTEQTKESVLATYEKSSGETSGLKEITVESETDETIKTTMESVSTVSESAVVISGSSLKTTSLSMIHSAKPRENVKLNFSYHILGCVKVDSHLNVREKYSSDANIVGTLSNNTFCNVLEIYDNGWAKIKSGKIAGYVSADYLLVGEKAQEEALKKAKKTAIIKNTSILNIRALPSTNSTIYGQAKKNTSIPLKTEQVTKARIQKLLKKKKALRRQFNSKEYKKMLNDSALQDWVCIKYKGKTAFASREYVKVIYKVKTGSAENKENSSLRARIVKYAKKFLGNRYVYGGSSLRHGTDCSGFIMRVYQHFGYKLGRSSVAQSQNGKKISRSKLQPGDLLFYKRRGRIGHVSMYIGNGKVIHASSPKNGIMISSIRYRKACRYVRIIKG